MMASFLAFASAREGKLRFSTKRGSSSGLPSVTLTIHFSLPTLEPGGVADSKHSGERGGRRIREERGVKIYNLRPFRRGREEKTSGSGARKNEIIKTDGEKRKPLDQPRVRYRFSAIEQLRSLLAGRGGSFTSR